MVKAGEVIERGGPGDGSYVAWYKPGEQEPVWKVDCGEDELWRVEEQMWLSSLSGDVVVVDKELSTKSQLLSEYLMEDVDHD